MKRPVSRFAIGLGVFVVAACNALVGNQNGVVSDEPGPSAGSDGGPRLGPDGAPLGEDGAAPPCVTTGLDGDARNCGRCFHDCLGGGCSAGLCAPVDLGPFTVTSGSIAVDGTHAYWGNGNQIVAASLIDGQSSTFYTAAANVYQVAAYGGRIAWQDTTISQDVETCSVDHCQDTIQSLASGATSYRILRAGPGGVFVKRNADVALIPWDGGAPAALTSQSALDVAFELDRFDLGVGTGGGQGAILRGLEDGGGVGVRLSTPWIPNALAIDGDRFLVSSTFRSSVPALFRVPSDGGPPEPIAPGVTANVLRLIGDEAYFLSDSSTALLRCRADACVPELLATVDAFDANASFAAWQTDDTHHLVRVVP